MGIVGQVEKRSFRECAGEKSPCISSECVGLRETYFNCKRGQACCFFSSYFSVFNYRCFLSYSCLLYCWGFLFIFHGYGLNYGPSYDFNWFRKWLSDFFFFLKEWSAVDFFSSRIWFGITEWKVGLSHLAHPKIGTWSKTEFQVLTAMVSPCGKWLITTRFILLTVTFAATLFSRLNFTKWKRDY